MTKSHKLIPPRSPSALQRKLRKLARAPGQFFYDIPLVKALRDVASKAEVSPSAEYLPAQQLLDQTWWRAVTEEQRATGVGYLGPADLFPGPCSDGASQPEVAKVCLFAPGAELAVATSFQQDPAGAHRCLHDSLAPAAWLRVLIMTALPRPIPDALVRACRALAIRVVFCRPTHGALDVWQPWDEVWVG